MDGTGLRRGDGRRRPATALALALALGACAAAPERTPRADGAPGAAPVAVIPGAAPDAVRSGAPVAAPPGVAAGPAAGAAAPLPPALDADRDGVADDRDDCPDGPAGEIVDEAGCALFTRVLEGVGFAQGDHRLGADARLALAALVADLEAHPGVVVRLEGHTDNRGTAASNLELSKLRVMSVARFLVARGVAPERLRPYGYGESRPRAGNATAAGRERNRRIEIGLESPRPAAPDAAPAGALAEPGAARQNGEVTGNAS